jgi:hypothetical protein
MKEETAVMWLQKLLENQPYLYKRDFEKALQMEREQIIKAFCEGYDHDGDNYDKAEISYYNETYKGGEQ